MTTASVTFGPSWPFSPGDPMSPGKPCNDQLRLKVFINAHWCHIFIAAVSIQTSGPGGPGDPSGPFSPILPCNRDQKQYLNFLYPSNMRVNISMVCIVLGRDLTNT